MKEKVVNNQNRDQDQKVVQSMQKIIGIYALQRMSLSIKLI